MHGFAKRGLALAAAASGLVIGIAGTAAADVTSSGDATNSAGIGSGWVVGGAGEIPALVCGTGALGAAVTNDIPGGLCADGHAGQVAGSTSNSGGIVAGDVVQAAAAIPAEVCTTNALVGGIKETIDGTSCSIGANGPVVSAVGSAEHDGGIASGLVVNAAPAIPAEVCGTVAELVATRNHIHGTTCTIS
jgi:ChpA-C